MSDLHEPEEEVLDAEPVFDGPPRIVPAQAGGQRLPDQRRAPLAMPAVQAAAVAAGGFVAGAAVLGLVHRRQQRQALGRGGRAVGALTRRSGARGSRQGADVLEVVGSRSLLVDVHLLSGTRPDS